MARTHDRFGLVAVGVIHLAGGPEPEALCQALRVVQARHPLLRARLGTRSGRPAFEVLDPAPPIQFDVAEWTAEADTLARAQRMLNEPFAPGEVPLLRVAYLASEERSDLLLAFHHAMMDAPSAARLVHDLLTACAMGEGGRETRQLPPSSDSLAPSGLRTLPGLVRFVAGEMASDWHYARETIEAQRPQLKPAGPTVIQSATLTDAETRALVQRSREERATLPSVLTAAMLLSALARGYPADTPLARAIVFSDLRPYLQPRPSSEDLACHVAMQRLSIRLGADTGSVGLWDIARQVAGMIHASGRRGGRFHAARMARHVVAQELKTENRRMGTVALSYVGSLALDATYGPTEVMGAHAFITTNRLSPEFSAFAHLFRGRLHLDTMTTREDVTLEDADALLLDVTRRLTA